AVLATPAAGAAHNAAAAAGGLSVFVGYAEDKEINTPDPASFPVPWAGAPNTTFLGNTVPGQTACGTLTVCYDTGAIRLDNPGTTPITVSSVSVDMHSSIPGGKLFSNLWGSFTVAPGKSVILAANPPASNPGYDNFDTSGYPANNCTPVTVAPTVTITVGGVATTLADSTHVLDTGGIDEGYCPPKQNESIQWRPIGAPGVDDGTLSLGPATVTAVTGHPVTETATLLGGDGSTGLPNVVVDFKVTSGPDAGLTGSAATDAGGHATFSVPGAGEGEDAVVASVTTVGTITSGQSRVMWTDGSAANWNSTDIGNPALAGSQSFDSGTGTWTVAGGGTGLGGTSDQFHFAWRPAPADGGATAYVAAQTAGGAPAEAGVMLRGSTDPGAPYYGAFVTPSGTVTVLDRSSQGGATATVATVPGSGPAHLWVTGSGGTFTAYESADGYDWTPIPGSAVSLGLGANPLAGLAVTGGDPATLNTATVQDVALPGGPPGPALPEPCPAPWTCADIGSPTPAGSQSFDPNSATWTIRAGGADITGTSDQFRYVWRTLSGNGSVVAHVASQTNTTAAAKAGVMFRTSTDPAAPNYAVVVSPGQGIKVQVRKTQGGSTAKLANPTGTAPAWLKITRSGSAFTAYTSADGVSWTLIPGSAVTLSLGTSLLAGLAVTSHNGGVLGTVTMNSVQVG
ncbi:MAG: hypothetical protein JO242_05095, partial [Streptosporangiaceae bacterium]|nr:hypothetical protein [Streptosporangiaceae bacterium]